MAGHQSINGSSIKPEPPEVTCAPLCFGDRGMMLPNLLVPPPQNRAAKSFQNNVSMTTNLFGQCMSTNLGMDSLSCSHATMQPFHLSTVDSVQPFAPQLQSCPSSFGLFVLLRVSLSCSPFSSPVLQ